MNYDSNQNQGYEPKMSGGNNAGYYMGESNNLMDMMAYGGSAGGSYFAQQMQRVSDADSLEDYQRSEAKRQKKGRTLGSILAFGGSLLGTAIGGSAGKAIGSAAGKYVGERLGAGKAKKYSTAGTVYNQQDLRDVSQASSDYNKGILGRSLLAGGESLAASYLSPGGFKGAPTKALPTASQYALPNASDAALKAGRQMGSEGAGLVFGRGGMDAIYGGQGGFNLPKPPSLLNYTTDNSIYSGGISSFNPYQNFEDGGLIGFGNGGYTAESILRGQDLDPTEEQLKLFQSFDPTKINQAKTGAEQSLLSMTGGQGLSSASGGFGAQQRGVTSAIESGQEMIGDTTEQAQQDFMSTTLGTAGDIVAGGGEFKDDSARQAYETYVSGGGFVPPGYTGGTPVESHQMTGSDGIDYIYSNGSWIEDTSGGG